MVSYRFRAAEEEETARLQGLVKYNGEPLLYFLVEVDEEVAADYKVEPRKGRILDKAVVGENDHLPERLHHLIVVVGPCEPSLKPLFAYI